MSSITASVVRYLSSRGKQHILKCRDRNNNLVTVRYNGIIPPAQQVGSMYRLFGRWSSHDLLGRVFIVEDSCYDKIEQEMTLDTKYHLLKKLQACKNQLGLQNT
ncbi:hypothetical protein BCT86_13060 [Vibrio breoganii]|nr:hypothetical protein BCT86_13060 [Vibrio breoganii]